jgi:hypothetical protein
MKYRPTEAPFRRHLTRWIRRNHLALRQVRNDHAAAVIDPHCHHRPAEISHADNARHELFIDPTSPVTARLIQASICAYELAKAGMTKRRSMDR